MTGVAYVAFALLALAAALSVVRLVRPGSLADRMIALDTLLIAVVNGIAVLAAWTGSGVFLDVLVVVGLLGFAGTAIVARYIERRGT
jgi:multisubunit Na+/H+ antiporter MnhF subunit